MTSESTPPPGDDEQPDSAADSGRTESPLPTDLGDDLFFEDAPGADERRARLEERRRRRGGSSGSDPDDAPIPPPPPAPSTPGPAAAMGSVGDRVAGALDGVRGRVANRGPQSSETGERPPVDDWFEDDASVGDETARDAASRLSSGGYTGGGPASPADVVMRRRILALGGLGATIVVLFLIVKAIGGGGSEPVPAPEPLATFDITIPEGLGRTQVAKVVKQAGIKGDYLKATEKAPNGFNTKQYGVSKPDNLEGFLFPATYNLEEGATAKDLVSRQLEAFDERMAGINLKQAEAKNLTAYDVVIIASMIEREVQVDKERKLVAAVIYNRLSSGEPLGIDSTTRYELDNYDEQITESELAADTPYNTRINAGLTPTPIGNPGLASLEAAAKPANSDVRYFVVKPYTCNKHVFTADDAEFQTAQAEYQAALAAEGGSPTSCPDGQ